jgi:hypothetical protein
MRWKPFQVERGNPLNCVACGNLVPHEAASEWMYELNAYDCSDEEVEQFVKAFNIVDPLADFYICEECQERHHGHKPSPHDDPMDWLDSYLVNEIERKRLESLEEYRRQYELDTGFLPGR